ncbi:site-specific DNA-methyltransferase [Stutzerimonas azotifigens]|uniref:site-specific DNA-methyltransferase (adenine-specific) n=1 Tax=Stutzerimonas azotifigens TaxID=291995 RepID=A0ABR5Z581_9GAMM|nr:site-specific DNA-methyltransferase [Stutzerimonas azotifigens]MBA1275313.1 site-specific DNA-methyltransferase [Stutzerimonas azotifigens]
MAGKTKLELTWIGKDDRPRLEPRILIEEPEFSYHAETRREGDHFDNMLIHGDNLLALKALETESGVRGEVKCIYIDPPYNTGNAFEHYDDGLEHSLWLSLMRERIVCLHNLLANDGFLCVHIDDSEGHYLKVMLDEIFGRSNYLTTIYVQVRYAQKTLKQDMDFHKQIEMIHVYRKAYGAKPFLQRAATSDEKFCFYIDEIGPGKQTALGGKSVTIFTPEEYRIRSGEPSEDGLKEIWATGSILDGNSSGRFFRDYLAGRASEDGLGALYKVEGIGDDKFSHRYFSGPKRASATKGKYYQGIPLSKINQKDSTMPIENFYDLAGAFGNCRHEGGVEFRSGKKPEALLRIILERFSQPGDLIIDSFAGSGTTGAVAQKMGRRWIMVELGNHAKTHIVPRMQKVIDGSDKSGVTEFANWKGGGGYRFFKLAPSLLQKDKWGNLVINKDYQPEMLAEAICKHFNYTYAPSTELYWMHGKATENAFIYVTTNSLTFDQLKVLSDEVGEERSLLVCCMAYEAAGDNLMNLTLKKIPRVVLDRCEWGRDDYSLKIAALPLQDEEPEDEDTTLKQPKKIKASVAQSSLFDGSEEN